MGLLESISSVVGTLTISLGLALAVIFLVFINKYLLYTARMKQNKKDAEAGDLLRWIVIGAPLVYIVLYFEDHNILELSQNLLTFALPLVCLLVVMIGGMEIITRLRKQTTK